MFVLRECKKSESRFPKMRVRLGISFFHISKLQVCNKIEIALKIAVQKFRYIFFLLLMILVQQSFSLTAELCIENIHTAGNQFLWEIHFRPLSGWTGGPLNANSYLLNASFYFQYTGSSLSAPVLVYQNPLVQGHYDNTSGITGGRVYVSTADWGDPQIVTQGTKYHLFTVSMTILNSDDLSDVEWDVLNTAIENFSGSIATGSDLTTIPPWSVNLTVTGASVQMRAFGGAAGASNGYDSALDIIAPLPSLDYYSYFRLDGSPDYLTKDMRHWAYPFNEQLTWELDIVNADQVMTTVSWDPSQLPREGSFTLTGAGTVDMRASNSVTFSGNKILFVSYNSTVSVTFSFAQMGMYMISLPVIPQDSSVSSLFPNAPGGYAYSWDPITKVYDTVTKIQPGKGYWLAIPAASSHQITGLVFNNYSEHFTASGWYMIGSVYGGTDFSDPDDNPDGSVLGSAFVWNMQSIEYIQTSYLNEKQGYWSAVFGECDLSVAWNGNGLMKSTATAFEQKYDNGPPEPPMIDWKTGKLVGMPHTYSLSQNYPNPFNENTTIEFALPEKNTVEIIIVDVLGREIRKMFDNTLNPGFHRVVWDGLNDAGQKVSSGIYFYTLSTKGFKETKKLLLVK
jgi:hypothetical protein